jgi:8-oxo-dGTP pyrophosphatase MutT (NUDIX family)
MTQWWHVIPCIVNVISFIQSAFADWSRVFYLDTMKPLDRDGLATRLRQSLNTPRSIVQPPPGYRQAAVLVPLVLSPVSTDLLLIKRTDVVDTHKGQIAFPGGGVEEGDTDRAHTALRETQEELGIDPSEVAVVGMLDDVIIPTGFLVTPVVGLLSTPPHLTLNDREVAEAFFVPIEFFLDSSHARKEVKLIGGERREVWTYEGGEHTIWGATARIIRSLLSHIGGG